MSSRTRRKKAHKTPRARYSSRLTSKYQATIPKEIRKRLHLKSGDRVLYEVLSDDSVVIRKNFSPDLDYLEALRPTLNEWDSEEDERAYKNL